MINYPNGKKITKSNEQRVKTQRGMTLESDINLSNEYFIDTNRAIIYKKPTPIQVVHVDYPRRTAAKIDEAYYKIPSTTDYNGIYRGKYIDFEAKETNSRTSFPFSSIHAHQITHLSRVLEHGAIAFIIIRFTIYDETFFIKAKDLIEFYHNEKRRSIPYIWFKENATLIPFSLTPPVNYIRVIDELYFKGE